MKTLLTILITVLFTGLSYGSTEVTRWPNNKSTYHKSDTPGFDYKKLKKKHKHAKKKKKVCPMLSDI
jgi:hypothetical protein